MSERGASRSETWSGQRAAASPAASEPAPRSDEAVVELDERGRACPAPVIALARAALDQPRGTVLRLLADDPAAAPDVAAWCRMRGHTLVSAQDQAFVVRL